LFTHCEAAECEPTSYFLELPADLVLVHIHVHVNAAHQPQVAAHKLLINQYIKLLKLEKSTMHKPTSQW
jgi:hypothetical protein